MTNKIVIFGALEAALLSYFYFTHDSSYEVVAFTVNREFIKEKMLFGLPVVAFEDIERTYAPEEHKMFVAVMYGRLNKTREEKYREARAKGYQLPSYVCSRAVVWPDLRIGDNCFITDNAVIQPFVEIGNNVVVSSGSIIGHHSVVKDHCFLAPGSVLLGRVTIEPHCFIGANSTIRDGAVVNRECIIGAGATVTKGVGERTVYVCNDGHRLSRSSRGLGTWLTSHFR